jgi:hypothetical protein
VYSGTGLATGLMRGHEVEAKFKVWAVSTAKLEAGPFVQQGSISGVYKNTLPMRTGLDTMRMREYYWLPHAVANIVITAAHFLVSP